MENLIEKYNLLIADTAQYLYNLKQDARQTDNIYSLQHYQECIIKNEMKLEIYYEVIRDLELIKEKED